MLAGWLRARREARCDRILAVSHSLLYVLHGWLAVQVVQGRFLYGIFGSLLYASTLPWWCAAAALGAAAGSQRARRPLLCASGGLLLWLGAAAAPAPWRGERPLHGLVAVGSAAAGALTLAVFAARWLRDARWRRWLRLR